MFTVMGDKACGISLQPPEYTPVEWLEGTEINDSAPRYLIASQRVRRALNNEDSSTLLVKIGDMGGGNVAIHLRRHWRLIAARC